ncbi:MAG: type II toxin-antitoxin system Phd/YefM family antitoxin [Bifidobacteriaceae bacterium]|nr:type II toxin-antitoxin system Phd/YefM family antitoxin [Bifidobacteriaceae bacterium]
MAAFPIAAARAELSALVEDAVRTHQRYDITRNGRRAAVLLSAADYDSLIETLDILSNTGLMADLAEAEEQLAAGESFSQEEVRQAMAANGRLP